MLLISHLNHRPVYLHSLLPPPWMWCWFCWGKGKETNGNKMCKQVTGMLAPEVGHLISWAYGYPGHAPSHLTGQEPNPSTVGHFGGEEVSRKVSHFPVPLWGCNCLAQLPEPRDLARLVSRFAVASSQLEEKKKAEKWHPKAARKADKTGAWFSLSPYEIWQVSVLEPGQSFRLIVIVVPAVTLLFTEALTGLQHDGCTHTLIL